MTPKEHMKNMKPVYKKIGHIAIKKKKSFFETP